MGVVHLGSIHEALFLFLVHTQEGGSYCPSGLLSERKWWDKGHFLLMSSDISFKHCTRTQLILFDMQYLPLNLFATAENDLHIATERLVSLSLLCDSFSVAPLLISLPVLSSIYLLLHRISNHLLPPLLPPATTSVFPSTCLLASQSANHSNFLLSLPGTANVTKTQETGTFDLNTNKSLFSQRDWNGTQGHDHYS